MSARGLTILRLATYEAAQRADGWNTLIRERNERATLAMLSDYVRRGFLTCTDYRTMQLTEAGRIRMEAGQHLENLKVR